ncbi:chitin synthase export chaperone [Laetiporus sulphureus 93-53]|uniref:Chitin synthase export chaperone n=1 Tax=Laetiporus sulphureus 93-53 TaxID=1314785 RepID=A0A165FJA7_9APHY|nr:chitin synthase export chaperone [Laetiporus sulphureus 93-53]KZT09058.1 chitin synthase export chaperone [Laetiporus sulphureus 93-53]
MSIKFGSFDEICQTAALVICPMVGSSDGIEPKCYSRNVDIAGTLIFQPATGFIHIVAIIMTAVMIFHIRSKYTAVGRKEILLFFYLYAIIELLALFLDSAIIPTANVSYPWFAAAYTGLVAAAYVCLLINGFVGFQFAEDGTPVSLWLLRLSILAVFGVCFFIAIATFKNTAGLSYTKPIGIWVIYFIWPLFCVVVYVVSQLILVFRTLEERWPIGDIVFGAVSFTIAQIILFAFSATICNAIQHYLDGLFFFTLCMLLSVMMVYKYWDSITREDLEFSVGSKAMVWEVKDPLLGGSDRDYEDDIVSSYHGGHTASLVGGVSGKQIYSGGMGQGRGYPPAMERY